ncbi:MAG TPA: hypothetical protein VH415_09755 [Nitrososphaeraceae archaeon]
MQSGKILGINQHSLTVPVAIAVAIIISSIMIIMPGTSTELSSFFSNWTVNISILAATLFSGISTLKSYWTYKLLVKSKSKTLNEGIQSDLLFAKRQFYTFFSLTIGLVLWTLAEFTWTYFQLILGIENPFPSEADAFWLLGYPFIILFTYGVNKILSKNGVYDRETLILLSVSAGLTLGYIFNLTFGIADILATSEDQIGWLIGIFYPILDTIALVPSLLIVILLRNNISNSNLHWSLFAGSIIILTIADIGFGYSELLGTAEEEQWFWDILYTSSYIFMAGALYAYFKIQHVRSIHAQAPT